MASTPELRSLFSDPKEIAELTEKAMVDGIASQFPVEGKRFTLRASNIRAVSKDFTHLDEKKALLSSSSLTYPIRGTLEMVDKATGKVVDKVDNYSFGDTFYITPKHTMIYAGNNYSASNLLVRLPGVFARQNNKGEFESEFNTGKGQSFSLVLNPETQVILINVDGSEVPVAVLLRDVLGISDQTITRYIPLEVWQKNLEAVKGKESRYLTTLYNRFVSKSKQVAGDSAAVKLTKLQEAIMKGQLSPITTDITLGVKKETMDPEVFLLALKNLILVYRGDKEEDNRDSLQFKRVQSLPDFIASRFEKDSDIVKKARYRIQFNIDRFSQSNAVPTIREVMGSKPYNKVFTDFITNSTLSSTPTETNPIESIEGVAKVTMIGPKEGGASSERMIPLEARNIHPSNLGILDPSRTPESSTAGIDLRFTIAARRDKDGILYTAVKDKQGKQKYISVQEMMKSTIGFPGQDDKSDEVDAQVRGKMRKVPRNQVDYWVYDPTHMYTITTNLVPFLNSNHPGRLTMAGKAITQALSLKDRELPLVQTLDDTNTPFITRLGRMISTRSPCDGTVTKVSTNQVEISDTEGKKHTIDLVRNLPFNMKGFLDDEAPVVKAGDKVKKGDLISDNNYTKGGQLALGRNLYVGYMPYKGFNHEDGIVVSRACADKLSSLHSYKYSYSVKMDTTMSKALFRRYYGQKFTPAQLERLDDKGIIKVGAKLVYGDPIFTILEKKQPTEIDRVLGRLDKLLMNPYKAQVETWDHEEAGEVVDVHSDGPDIRVLIKSTKPLGIGDKLTGFHGNKGIVSLILENHEMPHSKETGQPLDAILNPASVTSRINLGQIMETAVGKIAQKTGKAYQIKNYGTGNNLDVIKGQMNKLGISDTDTVYDPKTGKQFGQVMAGPQYFLKLFKTTDSNYASRNTAGYDSYLQPAKGGEEGAKGVGYMEFLGLLGSDARKNLREMATIKAEKNEEFWSKFMLGQPLPKPKVTFATKKFFDHLKAIGIHVREDQGNLVATPMSDTDVLAMSNGAIKNAKTLETKGGGQAEKGGLFDLGVTGGVTGTKWSHYKLCEPVLNPVFEKPVQTLLGLTKEDISRISSGSLGVLPHGNGNFDIFDTRTGDLHKMVNVSSATAGVTKKAGEVDTDDLLVGGEAFRSMLSSINPKKDLQAHLDAYKNTRSQSKKEALTKKIKYLKGLADMGVKDPGMAYTIQNVPILPPVMRPVIDKGANNIEFGDVNKLYKELILTDSEALKPNLEFLPHSELVNQRSALYGSMKAVAGLGEVMGPNSKKQGLKGIMTMIAGDGGPKEGMFHSRVLKRNQDLSGRGTIYAAPDVGFNEAKFPKDMMWTMFKMHIIRELVKNGMRLDEAKKAYDNKTLSAQNTFNRLAKEIPIMLNRPPTLMKTNVMAVYGIPIEEKTIGLNILHLPGFAADFDGDALTTYVPVTQEAIQEAKEKLLPQRHLSDARLGYGSSMFAPGHEAILGSVHLTKADHEQNVVTFKSEEEALHALHSGAINDNTPIRIAA